VTLRRSLIASALAVAAALPAAAPAYPPYTCGRTTVSGTSYLVRSHGPKCADAIRWSRAFIARHRSPKGFRCRAYGESVPVNCVRKGKKNTYFTAFAQ
jgi:hypothetical protein